MAFTEEQMKEIKQLIEEAGNVSNILFDKRDFENISKNGDAFKKELVALLVKYLKTSNKFANEEVESKYSYPKEYRVKEITEQVAILREFFPELENATYDESIIDQPLPHGAEGYFIIPRWENLASTYSEAVQMVLGSIEKQRGGFYYWKKDRLGEKNLYRHERTVKKLRALHEIQKDNNILVVASQFGLCHTGQSVRRAEELFLSNEFGLGLFEVACMLLTHPNRLNQHKEDIWIYCAGDGYSYWGNGDYDDTPYICFYENQPVGLHCRYKDVSCAGAGVASGFL